jgi:hypothetical protein
MILHIAQSNLTRNPQPHVLLQMDDANMATTHRSPFAPASRKRAAVGFALVAPQDLFWSTPISGNQSHPVLTDCGGHSDLSVSSVQTESPYYRATVRRKAYHDDVH